MTNHVSILYIAHCKSSQAIEHQNTIRNILLAFVVDRIEHSEQFRAIGKHFLTERSWNAKLLATFASALSVKVEEAEAEKVEEAK